jgi:hypothetical protein
MTQEEWKDMAIKRVTEYFVAANIDMINMYGPIKIHYRLGDKLIELAEQYATEIVLKASS